MRMNFTPEVTSLKQNDWEQKGKNDLRQISDGKYWVLRKYCMDFISILTQRTSSSAVHILAHNSFHHKLWDFENYLAMWNPTGPRVTVKLLYRREGGNAVGAALYSTRCSQGGRLKSQKEGFFSVMADWRWGNRPVSGEHIRQQGKQEETFECQQEQWACSTEATDNMAETTLKSYCCTAVRWGAQTARHFKAAGE